MAMDMPSGELTLRRIEFNDVRRVPCPCHHSWRDQRQSKCRNEQDHPARRVSSVVDLIFGPPLPW